MGIDEDNPDPPDSIPDEIIDFIQEVDIRMLDDLGGYVDKELQARMDAVLASDSQLE